MRMVPGKVRVEANGKSKLTKIQLVPRTIEKRGRGVFITKWSMMLNS